MGSKCGGCKSKCGVVAEMRTPESEKMCTGYVLKEASSGLYLSYETDIVDEPIYFLARRPHAIRFESREEAIAELSRVLLVGLEISHSDIFCFRPVKLVKKV